MTNALVNRIKQRLEAQRDFMRVVFSNHHALVWRLTDAPSLRALGINPKRVALNRSRAAQLPREVTRKPRVPRAIDNPDFETVLLEDAGTDFETNQNLVESQTEIASLESTPNLEISEQDLSQLEPQKSQAIETEQAPETSDHFETFSTPEFTARVVPAVRSGETIPPDVSPRAINTDTSQARKTDDLAVSKTDGSQINVPDVSQVQTFNANQIQPNIVQAVPVEPEANLGFEIKPETLGQNQEPVMLESQQNVNSQVIQDTNISKIEQTQIQTETQKTPQTQNTSSQPQTQPTKVARAFEALQKRYETKPQETRSSTVSGRQPDIKPVIKPENLNTLESFVPENQRLEASLESTLETQVDTEVESREITENTPVGFEANQQIETQNFELAAVSTIPKVEALESIQVEAFESTQQEARTSENEPLSSESNPGTQQAKLQDDLEPRATQTEAVAQEVPVESSEPQLIQPEQAKSNQTEEPSITPETRASSAPSEDTNWQRSMPGDPQSGVVEIIRAKPPREVRPNRNKETEPQSTQSKPPETETPRIQATDSTLPKQNLSERMKSLQSRFGNGEQTRFDPNNNSFAEKVEADSDAQEPAIKFQSISDVAQRLARRYSEPQETNSSENSTPQSGQSLNTTETRAASRLVQQDTQPIQLQESTRDFLEPLVGFDPSLARIFVSPQATEFTSSLNADGATVASDVYLNNQLDEQLPKDLGLLAHELTHVGQNLEANFVPPILLNIPSQNDLANESSETQARIVEAFVTNTASLFVPGLTLETAASRQTATAQIPNFSSQARTNTDAWDGLPAPWEAMPNLTPTSSNTLSPNTSSSSNLAGVTPVSDTSNAGVQLAETGRGNENPDNAPPGAAAGQSHPPAQDMDLLAQQVYEILKRRLSSERRREG